MLLLLLLVLAALALGLAYAALRARHAYWRRRGVPGPECSVPFGNYKDAILGRKGMGDIMFDVYQKYREQRYVGTHFVGTPLLHIHDLEIIREVLIREFQDFNGRAMYSDPDNDMISGQLFLLSGQPWRTLRVKLSPTFTTGKLRFMFTTFKRCGDQLREHIASEVRAGGGRTVIEIKELLACLGTDIITSVAFGIEANTLANPKSEFRRIPALILDPSIGMGLRILLAFMWPEALKALPTTLFPAEANDFFLKTVTEVIEYREKHGVERPDMLQLLIKLKNNGFIPPDAPGQVADGKEVGDKESIADGPVEKQHISIREIAAQCTVFFLAGYETTSSTLTFTLYLLAKHPEVQDKVVEEMREALDKHGGEIEYDTLLNLPYTDMVLNETMRLYPSVPFLNREAMRERKLPLTDLVLDKGTRIMIPIRALHMDPKYWDDPEEFKPERFTKDKMEARHPMVYLPFGDGPRICIGMRMGLIQMKMTLMTILTRAEVRLPADAPSTIKLSPLTVGPTPIDPLKLVFTERA